MSKKNIKADNWDGKSRPSNKAYDEGWQRIFGNPVVKEVKKNKKKDSYFDSKSVKEMLDEMD